MLHPLQLSIRAATAAGLSVAVAELLRLPFPIYALVSAVIVVDLVPARTRQLAAPRIAGTVIGAVLGACLSPVFDGGPAGIVVGVFAAMALTHVLRLPDAARLSGYVCAIVLLEHRDDQWAYATFRFLETLVGICAAVLVSILPKLLRVHSSAGSA